MAELKLVYFEGCPNTDKVRGNLKTAGYDFDEVRQDDLPDGHPLRNYASPTVLKNGQVIFGTYSSSGGGACSLKVPTAQQIKEKLENF